MAAAAEEEGPVAAAAEEEAAVAVVAAAAFCESMQRLHRFAPPFLSWPLLKAEDSSTSSQAEQ